MPRVLRRQPAQPLPVLVPVRAPLTSIAWDFVRRASWPLLLLALALASLLLQEAALELIFAVGVVAVGQEAEGSGAEESDVVEIGLSFKYVATATVKISSLGIKFNATGTGTSGRLALQADEGGTKPKEGVLCEGPIASVTAGEHLTTSLTAEPEVVNGTTYWLTVIPLGGTCKMKMGSTTSRCKSTVKHSLISLIASGDWGAAVNKGPVALWANGTAGGTEHPVTCGDTVSVTESVARAVALPRTVGDTVAVSESPAQNLTTARAAADTVAVSEAATGQSTPACTAGDTVTVSDSALGQATKARTASDTVTVSDTANRAARTLVRTTFDTVTVSEQATRVSARSRTCGDTVTFSDTATSELGHATSVEPCLIKLTVRPTVTIALTVRPTVRIDLEAR